MDDKLIMKVGGYMKTGYYKDKNGELIIVNHRGEIETSFRTKSTKVLGFYRESLFTQVEGYYIDKRHLKDSKMPCGYHVIYYILTTKGIVSIWGSSDLNFKMKHVPERALTSIRYIGKCKARDNLFFKKFQVMVNEEDRLDHQGFVRITKMPKGSKYIGPL